MEHPDFCNDTVQSIMAKHLCGWDQALGILQEMEEEREKAENPVRSMKVPGGVLVFATADHMLYEAVYDGRTYTVRKSDDCRSATLKVSEEGVGTVLMSQSLEGLTQPLLRMADAFARWKDGV